MRKVRKKIKLKKWIKITLAILALIIVLLIGIKIYENFKYDKVSLKSKKKKIITTTTKKEKESNSLSMVMVGDCLIHRFVYNDASNGDGTYSFSKMFTEVEPLIKGHDLAFYNQESNIGGKA